jgi:PKHD-type hydroxylase
MNQKLICPIAPFSSPGKGDECFFEDFLTNDDINYILARPEWLQSSEGRIGNGHDRDGEVNKDVRTTAISWMARDKDNDYIWQKITNTIWEANRRFFQFDLTGCYEAAQLGIYTANDNGHYNWHADSSLNTGTVPRKLSMSLLLSDTSEFEGGHFQSMISDNKAKEFEQKKGRAWFFPSWTLHRVTPVTKGVRRSLVLWVGGPAFK